MHISQEADAAVAAHDGAAAVAAAASALGETAAAAQVDGTLERLRTWMSELTVDLDEVRGSARLSPCTQLHMVMAALLSALHRLRWHDCRPG